MNSEGKIRFSPLKPCRVCGMDSGVRKMRNTNPEEFYVVCQVCGFKTKNRPTVNAATFEWNGGRNAARK